MVNLRASNSLRNSSIVPLTGGFGNQLFQYAFGMYLQAKTKQRVLFDTSIGNPREIAGEIALTGIDSAETPLFLPRMNSNFRWLFTKAFGWNLSNMLKSNKSRSLRFLLLSSTAKVLLQLRFKGKYSVLTSQDLGYDKTINYLNKAIFIGYFQTHFYASSPEVFKSLSNIRPKYLSEHYQTLRKSIQSTKPLLIHLRLTDYLTETTFGVPSLQYYLKAIKEMCEVRRYSDLWVVSDDIEEAKLRFRDLDTDLNLIYFDQSGLTDLEVWDLMREFGGYIISNSSFSWWAAFLRRNHESLVCAPSPWFQGMNDPELLIPEDWIKVNSL